MIINHTQLSQIRDQHRDKKIVFTDGVFDLLHVGHVTGFKKMKSLGDILIVAVLADSMVVKKKGSKRPIINENNRLLKRC